MARHTAIPFADGTGHFDCSIEPDWNKLNSLANAVDSGDESKLDELVALIVYEKEPEKYKKYLRMAAQKGNLLAEYECARDLGPLSIKQLIVYKKAVDADIYGSDALGPDMRYEEAKGEFICAAILIVVLLLIGYGCFWLFNWLLS